VAKLNPAGSALGYATYLGASIYDYGWGIAVDAAGFAYVTGLTESADFPVTAGAFQTTFGGGGDAYLTKLNAMGSGLAYSTFVGGQYGDGGSRITTDLGGGVYLTGYTWSANFPTSSGAYQTSLGGLSDTFVTKLIIGTVVTPTPTCTPSPTDTPVPTATPTATATPTPTPTTSLHCVYLPLIMQNE
jgi:hypothetical protein